MGPPATIGELNARAARWTDERIHARLHRGMGEVPQERFAIEATLLGALARRRFDTAYVEARRVHVAIPQIEWRGVRYSVPPRCLGQRVEVRQEVETDAIEIRWAAEVVGRHCVPAAGVLEVWDADHFSATQAAALSGQRGKHLALVVPEVPKPAPPIRLDIEGDVNVEVPDLSRYEMRGGS
jgi:hypothetical protein